MELKTLKDFEMLICEDFSGSNIIKEDELKQSVIQDIKLMRKCFALPITRNDIESYIKWKFNISEEDLKCQN